MICNPLGAIGFKLGAQILRLMLVSVNSQRQEEAMTAMVQETKEPS
jgi:hypothetical protein